MVIFINSFHRVVFWAAILFFISLFGGLVLYSVLSLEFKNSGYVNDLYSYLIFLIPLTILLTMAGTINKRNSKEKNSTVMWLTFFIAIVVFVVLLSIAMFIGFGGWRNEAILYRNNKDKNISINQQIWDVGALSYDRGSKRVVKLKPLLSYFYQVSIIDTTNLDKREWMFVNEEGDIHYP
jgi:hypothetical protein